MSETLRVGDLAIIRDVNGDFRPEYGLLRVNSGDISKIFAVPVDGSAGFIAANAGTLKIMHDESHACVVQGFLAPPNETELQVFRNAEQAKERDRIGQMTVNRINCHTCLWWRPPFDTGPGNCHNEQVKQLTNIGGDTYAPPTPAHFGCVQWESKDQPDNGEE